MFLDEQVGYNHIYGNFSRGLTFVVPPAYVQFRISDIIVIDDVEHTIWYILANVTSEPYECNFSTLDYSIGPHKIDCMVCGGPGEGLVGGGTTFFFEHQDRSGEQVLYTGASITVAASIIASIFGLGFAFYKRVKWEWDLPEPPTSRFEKHAVIPAPD